MKKLIFIIISLILTVSIYAEYIVNNGDVLDITIVKKNISALNFTTKVNENGMIKLYDYNKNNNLANFNQDNNTLQQNTQQETYIPIGMINVSNLNIDQIKNKIYDFYKNITDIQSLDIALSKSRYNVFIQLSNSIETLDYKRNTIYRDYINMSEKGAFTGDSIYIKKGENFYKKSIMDTVEPGITIIVDYNNIYINGEVRKAGAYPYIPEWTYLEYIARAGGFTANADIVRIRIMDKYGKKKSKKSSIEPGDIIYIPNNFMYYIRNFSLVLSVAISLLYIINTGFTPFWQ